jgi:Tfp pilus assembly protein PilO
MKMTSNNRLIVAILAIAAVAAAFWMLALSPKREESKKLAATAKSLEASLASHESEVAQAEAARDDFPAAYRQLVVLGKAVPGDDDTASLLVQLNAIAKGADVRFSEFKLSASAGEAPAPAPAPAPEASAPEGSGGTAVSTPVSPTEATASTLPLGASIGPAGLAVMPYSLSFEGDFFQLADFINGLDSLVKTTNQSVAVDGRLITIDGFSLEVDPNRGFPALKGSFGVTTYLTPSGQGLTGGATPAGPAATTMEPVAATTEGTP